MCDVCYVDDETVEKVISEIRADNYMIAEPVRKVMEVLPESEGMEEEEVETQ